MSETEEKKEDESSVRVGLRIRPQNAREKIDMCQVCTSVSDGDRQILLGKDKAFTFDYVYDMDTVQETIYNSCVRNLVDGCFEGYNATVFAYGQTGSGKTYTMGTGFDGGLTSVTDEIGIVPRAVDHLFLGIEDRRRQAFENGEPPPEFKVTAQFMELYNEEILDLMDATRDPEARGRKSHIRIHEDAGGGIYVVGVTTKPVQSLTETIECLRSGALSRATASTNMNVQSSRSHAIFTLLIRQHRVVKDENQQLDEGKDTDSTQAEFETLTAKFHFVDLAGSERLKRTGATGDRAKEGISINCGLLALGNVISALGDKAKRGSHVPYRDSKLTRLLQDSLGGNSRTLMIACISPSDRDFMETLNTLKYANRARNIKNKVVANQDKASKQLALLRSEIVALQQELVEYKTGQRTVDADGVESMNDMVTENSMLQSENDKLRQRIKAMQDTIESLKARNTQLSADAAVYSVLGGEGQASNEDVSNLVKKYVGEIEDLKTKLAESESMYEHLQRSTSRVARSPRLSISSMSGSMMSSSMMSSFAGGLEGPASPDILETSILAEAKKDIRKLKKIKRSQIRNLNHHESDKENVNTNRLRDEEEEVPDENEEDLMAEANEKVEHIENENEEDDMEEEDDDEEDNSESGSSSDSDSEGRESDNIHEDLANLTCEINIKQKLLEELEQTQKKMNSLKVHYEDKISQLHLKIKETEVERDKILSNIEKMSTTSTDKSKKVKQEFEKKLTSLQGELKKMQQEKKKHAKIQKNNSQYERHLKTLQHELSEMKKTKVRLMKQVKDEMDKNKHSEARRSKELTQLRKEQLRRDNIIKNLERQTSQKDAVLKRKQEEVEALRRRQKPMSSKAAGRVGKYDKPVTIPISPLSSARRRRRTEFSPKIAKHKWDSLEKNISSVIIKRQTVAMLEKDMDVWLRQREKCTKQLEKSEKRKKEAVDTSQPTEVVKKLSNTISDLALKVEHAQENISECQSNIMQMEESKEEGETVVEVNSLTERISLEEAKYIIEKLYQQALDKGQTIAHKDSELRELQGRLHQTELNNALQQDLLRHMMDDHVTIEVDSLMTRNDEHDDADSMSSSSSSPAESMLESGPPVQLPPSPVSPGLAASTDSLARKEKARRRTATAQDLLYAGCGDPVLALLPVVEAPEVKVSPGTALPLETSSMTGSTSSVEGKEEEAVAVTTNGASVGSEEEATTPTAGAGGGVGDRNEKFLVPPSRHMALNFKKSSTLPRPSPTLRRKEIESSPIMARRGLSRSSSIGESPSEATPPSSPTTHRRALMSRSTEENVFSRLTNNPLAASPNPNRGSIVPSSAGKPVNQAKGQLVCTHTAEGHTKAVLSVCATDQLMFTGSKDRTAKMWDLGSSKELTSFPGHPNNVLKVAFSPSTQLFFTASQSSVRVWDIRRASDNCIKTLSSSGLTTSGSAAFANRQTESPYYEHHINDIQILPDGSTLFCAAGNVVQIWDLRRFSQAGKLCGHQAPVTALAVTSNGSNNVIISGSKDHYIKIFDVIEDAAGILNPKFNLKPPHYDGISSLALQGNVLFSGSRDMCIKKWDLTTQQHKHSINAAHKDWVCALDFVPGTNTLVSGGRGGFLKIWHPDTCANLGEIKAHSSPINAIATNSSAIFTASNDCVGIWRHRPASIGDASDSSDVFEEPATQSS